MPGEAKGAGWGGPAKGKMPRGQRAAPFTAATGSIAGSLPKDTRTNAEKRERLLALYVEIAEDEKHPAASRIMAADKWLDRHEGRPIAKQEHSGPGGAPIPTRIEYTWADPTPEPASTE